MKLGIDARLINQTGVGTYIRNLLVQLEPLLPITWEVVVFLDGDSETKKNISNRYRIIRADQRWHSVQEQTSFLKLLLREKCDLVHFTYFSYPLLYRKPFVITIHDITPLTHVTGKASTYPFPIYTIKHWVYSLLIRNALTSSFHIVTPTKTVAHDIVKRYGTSIRHKITPIYEGCDSSILQTNPASTLPPKCKKPYLLYVGNFYPHKNIERLLLAFSQSNSRGKYTLILVGPNDYFSKRIQKVTDPSMAMFVFNVSHQTLARLYIDAECLIHPSLSEGFGLTIIEALNFNCPVLASKINVFDELLGTKRYTFNPKDTNDIRRAIDLITLLPRNARAPYDRSTTLERYSFSSMARQTLKIYKNFYSSQKYA